MPNSENNDNSLETTTIRVSKLAAKWCKFIGMHENTNQQDITNRALEKYINDWKKKHPGVKLPGDK